MTTMIKPQFNKLTKAIEALEMGMEGLAKIYMRQFKQSVARYTDYRCAASNEHTELLNVYLDAIERDNEVDQELAESSLEWFYKDHPEYRESIGW